VEGASSLIFLVLLGAMMYFLIARPQRQRVQRHQALVDSLEVGDEIVTIGGLFGTIEALGDDYMDLKVDSTTTLRFMKTAVARVVVDEAEDEVGGAEEDTPEEEEPR
jgi:preprotein translocase subunit YajC